MWHFIHSLCFMVLSCTFLAVCKEHSSISSENQIVFLRRTNEPNENVVSVLRLPDSWKLEGGLPGSTPPPEVVWEMRLPPNVI